MLNVFRRSTILQKQFIIIISQVESPLGMRLEKTRFSTSKQCTNPEWWLKNLKKKQQLQADFF